jgi:hypothetical protein
MVRQTSTGRSSTVWPLAATGEIAIITSNNVNLDPASGSEAVIIATMSDNGSTGTTLITITLRQGSGIIGTIVGGIVSESITAANTTTRTFAWNDLAAVNLQYTVTVSTTGTTIVPSSALNTICAFQVAD